MADEQTAEVTEVLDNSQETQTKEQGQQADSTAEGTTVETTDSESKGTTEESADARSSEQIQESERYHQGINDKLKTTVTELRQKLAGWETKKPVKADDTSQKTSSVDTADDYATPKEEIRQAVAEVFDEKFGELTSQAAMNEQMATITDVILKFKEVNNISDDTYNSVMKSYGSVVKRELKAKNGNPVQAAEMLLETLANRASLARDTEAVEAKKVDASIKGKALQGVQKPATSGAPPTPVKKTESEELLEDLRKVGGSEALSGFFSSNSSA